MKKISALMMCLLLAFSSAVCLAEAQTYTASADGMGGAVTVEMTVDDGAITGLAVVSHRETAGISDGAIERIPAAIVASQSLAVDTVAGATVTSEAILAAAEDCASQAGMDVEALKAANGAAAEKKLTAGTYTATRHGHHSDITVEVKVTEDAIESVAIVAQGETTNISDAAYDTLTRRIVEEQSFGVDTVAGATFTSSAVLSAVSDCMEQAGGSQAVSAFGVRVESEPWSTEEKTLDTDVVVVGSGMAGICAAISAQDEGASVVMLEKLPFYGGTSQTAGGGYFYAEDKERMLEYELSRYNGTRKGNAEMESDYPNRAIVEKYLDEAKPTLEWFESKGMLISYYPGSNTGYAYEKTNEDGTKEAALLSSDIAIFSVSDQSFDISVGVSGGDTFFDAMIKQFKANGGELYLETAAQSLMTDESGAVVGVKAVGKDGRYTINAKSVILCAGGFGASEEAIAEYGPAYAGEYNVTLPGNTGDGIRMAEEIGAAVHQGGFMMASGGQAFPEDDSSKLHAYMDPYTPTTAMYVNSNGQRVMSEEFYCGGASQTFVNPDSRDYYWIVINEANASASEAFKQRLEAALEEGNERFFREETLSQLADDMKVPYTSLAYTLNHYNTMCLHGEDTDFYKSQASLVAMEEGPWYAIKAYVNYFGTVGGLVTDEYGAVLDTEGNAIEGLYAAGENGNGGLFNLSYIGGHAIGGGAVFGKLSGEQAADHAAR
ncbi:MAG: FAD-dependent oxidoreductase [Clostridia bacterium]|nr:FAD-dependent oxidoreductase [Clostridia bacterium]